MAAHPGIAPAGTHEDTMDEVKPWGECQPRGITALAFGALKHRVVRGSFKKPVYRFIQARCPAQDVLFAGIKLRCHIADNGPERFVIFQERRSSWDALRMSTDVLKPGDTFVDVGANFGLFSAVAAKKVGPSGRVVAIEPHPELIRRLRFNMTANGFDQVRVFPTAVGEEAGEAVLFVNTASFAESRLQAGAGDVPDSTERATPVPITPLAEIVADAGLSRIDSLKIDIEGFEDRALVPFFRSAPRELWPRRVLVETIHAAEWANDCVADMRARGYSLAHETKSDALLTLAD
jgi:FkbM family methyltransferase